MTAMVMIMSLIAMVFFDGDYGDDSDIEGGDDDGDGDGDWLW